MASDGEAETSDSTDSGPWPNSPGSNVSNYVTVLATLLVKVLFNLLPHMNFYVSIQIFTHFLVPTKVSKNLKFWNFQKWTLNSYVG